MFSEVKIWHKASLYFMFSLNHKDIIIYPKEFFTVFKFMGKTYATSWSYNTMQHLQNSNLPKEKEADFKKILQESIVELPNTEDKEDDELLDVSLLSTEIVNTVPKYKDILGLENPLTNFLKSVGEPTVSVADYKMFLDSAFNVLKSDNNSPAKKALLDLIKAQDKYKIRDLANAWWYLYETLKNKKVIDKMVDPNLMEIDTNTYTDDEEIKYQKEHGENK